MANATMTPQPLNSISSTAELKTALDRGRERPAVRLGQALIELGFTGSGQIEAALQAQQSQNSMPLGEWLVQHGHITQNRFWIAFRFEWCAFFT